jgi:hypothetical protein
MYFKLFPCNDTFNGNGCKLQGVNKYLQLVSFYQIIRHNAQIYRMSISFLSGVSLR